MSSQSVPAIFETDAKTGEATGIVYAFCSVECRTMFAVPSSNDCHSLGIANTVDLCDGHVCEQCGKEIAP